MIRHTGYINGGNGDLFVVEQLPTGASCSQTPVVIILQPLFEELNMARRYVNSVCRELSRRGFATLLFDLSCSGDSTGECVDADWQAWGDDVATVCRYLAEREYSHYYMLAIRGGCLLFDDIEFSAAIKIDGGVLLEPEFTGHRMVTSLLRLRAFSSGFGNRPVEKVSELRNKIDSGETLEIAGTLISSKLFRELSSATYKRTDTRVGKILQVIDIIATRDGNEGRLEPVSTPCSLSTDSDLNMVVSGPSFWSSIEYQIDSAQVSNLVDNFWFANEFSAL